MKEIQGIIAQYPVSNVYKGDESGLFYHCEPRKSYLSLDEDISQTPGIALQKYMDRITLTFCDDADGLHVLPVRYIVSSQSPR